MTTRNLDALFRPRAIALIGASNTGGSVGAAVARNLLSGGFDGPILPVNPHATAIQSALAYRSVAELPMTPDLAVIATPPAAVVEAIEALALRGCRTCVVITAGLDAAAKARMLAAARPGLMRLMGPNCLGFLSPGAGINASFALTAPKPGRLALIAQSGAVAAAAIDWACGRDIGFSHVATIGDAMDVDAADLLDYLALDPETAAILLYVESLSGARKFMSAARSAARAKPVVVIKAGRSAAGARAAFSHTGALAGADAVYEAAFRRAGMLRVQSLGELFDAAATLNGSRPLGGERLAIVTNGGGAGVLAADALSGLGLEPAPLSDVTRAALDKVLPSTWSHANPIDLIGDAPPARYLAALEPVLADPDIDAVLVMNCPTAITDSAMAARAVVEAGDRSPRKPTLLSCWLGGASVGAARDTLSAGGVPTYDTPDAAIAGFGHLVAHRRNQAQLLRTPGAEPGAADLPAARAIIAGARAAGRLVLNDEEVRGLAAAYAIPTVETRTADTPRDAARVAEAFGGRVALKIRSAQLSHKSDVGGVSLDLAADQVETAAEAMLARVRAAAPEAEIAGFTVQPMIVRPHALELLAGLARDPTFGPVVLFGQGGVAVEALADRAVGLPPLDDLLARDMIERTRVARLLHGFRDRPAADLPAIGAVLVRLSHLACDLPEVQELDINPLIADDRGVLALDLRVRLAPPDAPGPDCAIRPYPAELARRVEFDGAEIAIRPVRPHDAPGLAALVEDCDPDDRRLRFGAGLRSLPTAWAARLSQIDYDRAMALVAEASDGAILGVGRFHADPEGESAEFALLVRSDLQRRGLGHRLLGALLDCADARGLKRLWGDVARTNAVMLELAAELGFVAEAGEDATRLRLVRQAPARPRE